ncbi:MAG: FtsK/SpoIIIE domain-containing protein [Planctomycetota bacterium]
MIESERAERAARIASKRDEEAAALDRRAARHRGDTLASHEQQTREIERAHDDAVASAEAAFDDAIRAAQQAWQAATQASGETARTLSRDAEAAAPGWSGAARSERSAWDADAWARWSPPTGSASLAPIGRVRVELPGPPDATPRSPGEPTRGAVLDPPLALDVPGGLSLLIEADQTHRDLGIETLRCAMLRLLCALPPGRVRFTLLDPVGLGQSFAGFARLGDHDPRLIAGRIWSEQRHIEQRLADLTEHMENVIQKYLRDEFESIEAYNTAAGEIAEAYRVLVIADFPRGFNDEALRRLASIADSGARCGVHTMILTDPKEQPPAGVSMQALREGSLVLRSQGGRLRPGGAPLADAHVEIDPPAPDALSASLVEKVGAASLDAGRVEVPFATLSPESLWSRSTRDELRVPIGRTGATRQQELVLGHGTAQHALLAGKTGSGKSTLLHVLITAAAQWHSPDELELYLVDFKKGVEFKAYADGSLPHVRAVAIESDREFGLSVLEKLDAVLRERGEVFRKQGVQSLPQYRRDHPGGVMPRVVLVVDEFQELFVEDDRVAQEASLLLDRLVRQGRAFGVHVLLGSQTLSGAYTLARSTMGQMGVRVALQCSETDSYLILSEDNGAARLLTRPGEAIYNDQGGLVEGNSPFQTAWLADHDRDDALAGVGAHAASAGVSRPAPIVFEGNEPGDLTRNAALGDALARVPETPPPALRVWLGEPVSIKDPASGVLRRRTGSNLLLVGADEDAALGMLASGLIGLGAQLPAAHGSFVLVDGLPEDDPRSWLLGAVGDALPQPVHAAGWREAETAVRSVHETVRTRERDNILDGEPAVLVLNGLHRLRALRRKEDDFSFSMDDNAEASVDKLLEEIVRDGPGVGVFTIAWCDSSANLSRALGRQAIGEFDQRVLMQMSAADSSALGESGSAARLGPHRALLFSLETGAEEKLRPYRVPTRGDVESLAQRLRARREG